MATIPKNGAYRNFQTSPTATEARTNGAKNTIRRNVLPRFTSATSTARNSPTPGQEHDRDAGEQERVQQTPMEDGVAEDRPHVVIEPDEVREVEALACHAR